MLVMLLETPDKCPNVDVKDLRKKVTGFISNKNPYVQQYMPNSNDDGGHVLESSSVQPTPTQTAQLRYQMAKKYSDAYPNLFGVSSQWSQRSERDGHQNMEWDS